MKQSNFGIQKKIFRFLAGFGVFSIIAALTTRDMLQSSQITFTPLFQVLGKIPQSISRSVTKVLPIDSVDEGELGKTIAQYYSLHNTEDIETNELRLYLMFLLKELETFKKKPFSYVIYILDSSTPNAMALPGGVILVTRGLLKIVRSESEIVAVLAHEMGHIELSHCFDSVKYEILSKKIMHNNLGSIADFARSLFLVHTFSKTQEEEADQYGFQLLTNSKYDPTAMARAFIRLKEEEKKDSNEQEHKGIDPVRDYLMSHPSIDQRITKFSAEAKLWWNSQKKDKKRYVGVKNWEERIAFSSRDFGEMEWISGYLVK